MLRSLRFKAALGFSVLAIALLLAQALGVRALIEAQEEKLIAALIHDDMADVLQGYQSGSIRLPPFDARLGGYVSGADRLPAALPASVEQLPGGTHQLLIDGTEIHVAIALLEGRRLYRIYNFNAYEKSFKKTVEVSLVIAGVFALLTIWLSFGLSGLLVRQVADLARQVKGLRLGRSASIQPGKYDETEVLWLVDAFNDYHRRMAQMIEREKEFTGNVSHELRTPLTAIKTSCELLDQDASIVGKSRARLRQIERAADRMQTLVGALLMLAREGASGKVEPINVAGMIDAALEPFAGSLAARRIQGANEVEPTVFVVANPAALTIVLSNLIDNAVRHTEDGRICFSYREGCLHIEDNGAGISAQALPHVFDRFYQASSPGSADRSGAGIGLSLVRQICERYGWPVKIASELNRGTRVSLRLPLAQGQAGPAPLVPIAP